MILVGTVAAKDGQWTFKVTESLKSGAAQTGKEKAGKELAVDLSGIDRAQAESIRGLVGDGADAAPREAVLFTSQEDKKAVGYLHVEGAWLSLAGGGEGKWQATGLADKMSGVFAGGTDMLIRMSRYLLADGKATVPVAAGTAWMKDACKVAKLEGAVGGMAAVERMGDKQPYLFVACDKGDRIFRAKPNDEAFEDVTPRGKLDTRSRQFAWFDLDGDGQADLVSWDGTAVAARLWDKDGTFRPAGKGAELPDKKARCLGLVACSNPADGAPAVLVSTSGLPVLLARAADGGWREVKLPDGPAAAQAGDGATPCIVADLDNDGYWDILQPRAKAGVIWRGKAGGFELPTRCDVACDGAGRTAVGDFNQDGLLDIFISGPKRNELWENASSSKVCAFRPVIHRAGSIGRKAGEGLTGAMAVDLNHDGLTDLCLLAAKGSFTYHFNRGFRCFGEEGDLRLPAPDGAGEASAGQVACATADFNRDGSLDLAVAFADGQIVCYYNDAFTKPMLRVSHKGGTAGPVTVAVWQGEKFPLCVGAQSIDGHGHSACFTLRDSADCTIKWTPPGSPPRTQKIKFPDKPPEGGLDVILEP